MLDAVLPLAPVFATIALGYGMRQIDIIDEGAWPALERLTYYLFLPALLIHSIASTDINDLPIDQVLIVVWLVLVIVVVMLLSMRRTFAFGDPSFAAVLQGAIRPNTYVALAAAFALHAEDALPSVALAIVAFVPLVNLFAVLGHARFGKAGAKSLMRLLLDVFTNPLILACAAGIALNRTNVEIPRGVDTLLEMLGRAALPLGLVTVGAALEFSQLRGKAGAILASSLFKLMLLPAMVMIGLNIARVEGVSADVVLLFAATPASISCYIVSRQMGGDAPLMAGIITLQSLAAALSLPFWLYLRTWFI
jgi:malonate transporter